MKAAFTKAEQPQTTPDISPQLFHGIQGVPAKELLTAIAEDRDPRSDDMECVFVGAAARGEKWQKHTISFCIPGTTDCDYQVCMNANEILRFLRIYKRQNPQSKKFPNPYYYEMQEKMQGIEVVTYLDPMLVEYITITASLLRRKLAPPRVSRNSMEDRLLHGMSEYAVNNPKDMSWIAWTKHTVFKNAAKAYKFLLRSAYWLAIVKLFARIFRTLFCLLFHGYELRKVACVTITDVVILQMHNYMYHLPDTHAAWLTRWVGNLFPCFCGYVFGKGAALSLAGTAITGGLPYFLGVIGKCMFDATVNVAIRIVVEKYMMQMFQLTSQLLMSSVYYGMSAFRGAMDIVGFTSVTSYMNAILGTQSLGDQKCGNFINPMTGEFEMPAQFGTFNQLYCRVENFFTKMMSYQIGQGALYAQQITFEFQGFLGTMTQEMEFPADMVTWKQIKQEYEAKGIGPLLSFNISEGGYFYLFLFSTFFFKVRDYMMLFRVMEPLGMLPGIEPITEMLEEVIGYFDPSVTTLSEVLQKYIVSPLTSVKTLVSWYKTLTHFALSIKCFLTFVWKKIVQYIAYTFGDENARDKVWDDSNTALASTLSSFKCCAGVTPAPVPTPKTAYFSYTLMKPEFPYTNVSKLYSVKTARGNIRVYLCSWKTKYSKMYGLDPTYTFVCPSSSDIQRLYPEAVTTYRGMLFLSNKKLPLALKHLS